MSKSAVDHMEVRWRVKGTTQWSPAQAVAPTSEVVVEGLERDKDYEFEVRNVSNCGAPSIWVPSDYTVPGVAPGTLTLAGLKTEVDNAAGDAAAANAELQTWSSDGVLSPAEKPAFEHLYAGIVDAQAGIDAQANAFGITTEKSDYDNAISTLTAYLNTLTTPVAWDNKSGTTTITASTFLGYFNAVYTKRQTLLNAIYAAAKGLADAAQKGVDSNAPLIINPYFTTGDLTGWTSDHGTVVFEAGANGPASASTTYARRNGSAGAPNEALRNLGKIPVYAGSVVKAQCLVRGINTPNGTAGVRISWRDKSDTEITTSPGNTTTGNATNGTYVTGAAPADGFAHVECQFSNHTTGSYTVDNFAASSISDSMDQVPDSATRFAAIHDAPTQAGIGAPVANLFPNPSGALGTAGWGFIGAPSGWQALHSSDGWQYRFDTPATAQTVGVYFSLTGLSPNTYTFSADVYFGGLQGGVFVFDATGTGFDAGGFQTASASNWRRVSWTFTIPSGANFANIRFFLSSGYGTGLVAFRRIKVEFGSVATPFDDFASQMGNQLTNAGSGQRLGDQGNAPASLTSSLGMVRSATALTAYSTGAVNVNAHTVTYGTRSVLYNTLANAVVGLSQGNGYYIYTRDNGLGGSPAWNATTSAQVANGFDDGYNAGYVTIPSSGSSGGGGAGGPGGGGCVCADMWLRPGLTARDLARRWRWWKPWLWFLRGPDGWHLIRRRPRIVQEPCVRATVADGAWIDCSIHTPVTTQTGESVQSPMLYGHLMATDSGWQRVVEVESLPGLRDVVRICVGGHSFFAGANPFFRLGTHNVWKN